jgi:hypothetical protein
MKVFENFRWEKKVAISHLHMEIFVLRVVLNKILIILLVLCFSFLDDESKNMKDENKAQSRVTRLTCISLS